MDNKPYFLASILVFLESVLDDVGRMVTILNILRMLKAPVTRAFQYFKSRFSRPSPDLSNWTRKQIVGIERVRSIIHMAFTMVFLLGMSMYPRGIDHANVWWHPLLDALDMVLICASSFFIARIVADGEVPEIKIARQYRKQLHRPHPKARPWQGRRGRQRSDPATDRAARVR